MSDSGPRAPAGFPGLTWEDTLAFILIGLGSLLLVAESVVLLKDFEAWAPPATLFVHDTRLPLAALAVISLLVLTVGPQTRLDHHADATVLLFVCALFAWLCAGFCVWALVLPYR